jgi:hypothetical protein
MRIMAAMLRLLAGRPGRARSAWLPRTLRLERLTTG